MILICFQTCDNTLHILLHSIMENWQFLIFFQVLSPVNRKSIGCRLERDQKCSPATMQKKLVWWAEKKDGVHTVVKTHETIPERILKSIWQQFNDISNVTCITKQMKNCSLIQYGMHKYCTGVMKINPERRDKEDNKRWENVQHATEIIVHAWRAHHRNEPSTRFDNSIYCL